MKCDIDEAHDESDTVCGACHDHALSKERARVAELEAALRDAEALAVSRGGRWTLDEQFRHEAIKSALKSNGSAFLRRLEAAEVLAGAEAKRHKDLRIRQPGPPNMACERCDQIDAWLAAKEASK